MSDIQFLEKEKFICLQWDGTNEEDIARTMEGRIGDYGRIFYKKGTFLRITIVFNHNPIKHLDKSNFYLNVNDYICWKINEIKGTHIFEVITENEMNKIIKE